MYIHVSCQCFNCAVCLQEPFKYVGYMSLSALSVFGQSGLCFHFHNSILGAEAFHFDKIRFNTFFFQIYILSVLHLRKLCLPQACDDFLFFLRLL